MSAALPGNWYPPTRAALLRLLSGPARGPAVFDWDNTCILNDLGDATFRHQLDRLALRLTPEQARAMLTTALHGHKHLHGGFDLAQRAPALLAAYTELWPALAAGNAAIVRDSPAHRYLRAGLGCLYTAIEQTPGLGAQVAYPWLTHWFDGFARTEIEALAWQAWQAIAQEPLGQQSWECDGMRYAFRTGLVAHAEMRALMEALQAQGFTLFVVTASHEAVVRGVAPRLGFPVPSANIYGMRPYVADYPLTYRAGKVEVIRRYLPGPPLLVAGDTNTDVDMLTAFTATQLRLVIHRSVQGEITRLHAEAQQAPGGRTLLQGRDERTGDFLAAPTSCV